MSKKKNEDFKVDFIGVGAEKAGTTWLSKMLDAHPQICLSEPKEVCFFNRKNYYNQIKKINNNFKKGLSWYKKRFFHCRQKVKGEFSTPYLWDEVAAERILKTFPKVKIIISIRDPVKRAYSQYLYHKNVLLKEKRSFKKVIKQEGEYIQKGMYFEQIKRYLQLFGVENVLIITLDEIKSRPKKILSRLYKFLNVEESFIPRDYDKKVNYARRRKFKFSGYLHVLLRDFLINLKLVKMWFILKKIFFKRFLDKFDIKIKTEKKMDDKTYENLQKIFREDILKTQKLIEKDLTAWL